VRVCSTSPVHLRENLWVVDNPAGNPLVHTRGRYLALATAGVRDAEILDDLDDNRLRDLLALRRRRCYVVTSVGGMRLQVREEGGQCCE
jgi:hypothetical protein